MENLITQLYKSRKTIFTSQDIALISGESNQDHLKAKISYYVQKKSLLRLTRGVFALDKDYDIKELATSLYKPSYISFETVLRETGVIFQHYETVFMAGPLTKTVTLGKHTFTFRKLKNEVLYHPAGIIQQMNYAIATPERAFLDMIYLYKEYYFDNLRPLNWKRCFELVKIYKNQELVKRLHNYYNHRKNAE